MDNFNKYLNGEDITLDEALDKDATEFDKKVRAAMFDFFEHYDENIEEFFKKLDQLPNNPGPFKDFVNVKDVAFGDRVIIDIPRAEGKSLSHMIKIIEEHQDKEK